MEWAEQPSSEGLGRLIENLDLLFSEAESAASLGNLAEAVASCQTILAKDQCHRRARILLGVSQARLGRLDEARKTLEIGLQNDPNCPVTLNWLVAILREQKEHDKAIETCQRIIELAPKDAESRNNLGMCLMAAARFEQAARAFHDAERLNLHNVVYYRNGAIAHAYRKSTGDAEAAYRRGLAFFPDDAVLNAGLGELLLELDEVEPAITHLRAAVASDPAGDGYEISLAQALVINQEFDEAEQIARALVAANPSNARAHAVIGSIMQHRGAFEASTISLRRAVELDPELAGTYFELVYGARVTPEDRPILAKMAELIGGTAISEHDRLCLNYAMGKAHEDIGEFETSMRYFEAANSLALTQRRKNKVFASEKFREEIDRKIERYDASYFAENRAQGLPDAKPIFVVGMMRTGSTLVEQILSSHPDIGAAGELLFWPDHICGLESRFGVDFEQSRQLGRDYLEILGRYGAKRVTDKMTDNVLHLGVLATLFPNARIICCRRLGPATCLSLFTTPLRFSQAYLHDKQDIADAFRQYSRLMDHWIQVLPSEQYTEVWYRDIVTDKEPVARRLVDFCGLEWNEACVHHEKNNRIVNTASKWQARQPIYTRSVERWQNFAPWIQPFIDLLPVEDRKLA